MPLIALPYGSPPFGGLFCVKFCNPDYNPTYVKQRKPFVNTESGRPKQKYFELCGLLKGLDFVDASRKNLVFPL